MKLRLDSGQGVRQEDVKVEKEVEMVEEVEAEGGGGRRGKEE